MIMTIAQMATGHNASDAALIMQLSNQSGMSAGASANAASEANSLSNSMNQDLMDWVASLRPARYIFIARKNLKRMMVRDGMMRGRGLMMKGRGFMFLLYIY